MWMIGNRIWAYVKFISFWLLNMLTSSVSVLSADLLLPTDWVSTQGLCQALDLNC